jgi:RNA polymerase sigma factor (sigma-70 family)
MIENSAHRFTKKELTALVPYVYAVAFRLTFDQDRAEDLAQETLLSAWEKRDQLANTASAKGWVRAICVNHHLMRERSAMRGTLSFEDIRTLADEGDVFDPAADIPSHDDELIAEETFRDIRNGCFLAMARKLTLYQRTVFSLIDMFGMTIDDTAKLLDLSVSAVKGLLFRARSNLYNFFDNRCEWISAEAACRCGAWFDFAGRRETIREELKNRKLITSFEDTPENREHTAEAKKRILHFYQTIPDRTPDDKWYTYIVSILSGNK